MRSSASSSTATDSGSSARFILGVDAGGTKTAACLAESHASGETVIIGRGRSSSGNPLSVGFHEATRAISEAVDEARADTQRPQIRISRAVLSIAGSTDRETTRQFIDWARKVELADEVAICSDFLPVLAAGTPDGWGIALISGTGSVAYARTSDGRASRFGGWGFLLGDDGSGYAIGRAAIRFALEDLESHLPFPPVEDSTRRGEGRSEGLGVVRDDQEGQDAAPHRRPLTITLLEELRVASVPELAQAIYSNPTHRAAIASLASLVTAMAEAGDAGAVAIVDQAASELATLVTRAASVMDMAGAKIPLAVAGGVLVGSRYLQSALAHELVRRGFECNVNVVEDPLHGCLRLASPEFAAFGVAWH